MKRRFLPLLILYHFRMPIVNSRINDAQQFNAGLASATARVIVDPELSLETQVYISRIVNQISEADFQTFASGILMDPTVWTLRSLSQTNYGQQLSNLSDDYIIITDVTCTHSVRAPRDILVTVELSMKNVKYSRFSHFLNDFHFSKSSY